MYISHFGLTNFRNFSDLQLDFLPGITILFGDNAQGKSSLLEAMYVLAVAKSPRAENEHEVVSWSSNNYTTDTVVAGTISRATREIKILVGYRPDSTHNINVQATDGSKIRKHIQVEGVRRTATELLGTFNAVLFTAEDIRLIFGPASMRRRYLDILLSQLDSVYLRTLQRYNRVMLHRNKLLKLLQENRAQFDELAYWDQELSQHGSWIVQRRKEAVMTLNELAGQKHIGLTNGDEELKLDYVSTFPVSTAGDMGAENQVIDVLANNRIKEVSLGYTTIGPHRDELEIIVNNVEMRRYASRGQARTIALSMRLAEAQYLSKESGEVPVLLLDDVLSEMDPSRRDQVFREITEYQQAILTTADLGLIPEAYLIRAMPYRISDGQVRK